MPRGLLALRSGLLQGRGPSLQLRAAALSGACRSSGDLIADSRYAYAAGASAAGDDRAAADLFAQCLERAPGFAPAAFGLGCAFQRLGRPSEARAAFELCLRLAPEDEIGAGLRLARLSGAGAPEKAPPAFVAALFDGYAGRFNRHLTLALAYDGPARLRALADRLHPETFTRMLDLGCGAGLAAEAFAGRAEAVFGVDLSPRMAALARATGLYRSVEVGDAIAFLAQQAAPADLIAAADLAPYLGDLSALFAAAALALAPGGLFVLTAQAGEGEIALGEEMRFSHSPGHIRRAAAAAGLECLALSPVSVRRDRGVAVPGLLAALSLRG